MEQLVDATPVLQMPPAEPVNTVSSRQMPSQETIRKYYLNHEAGVKSIGTFYYIGAVFLIISGVVNIARPDMDRPLLDHVLACMLLIAIGVLLIFVGYGLKKLQPWSRIVTFVFACIGLIAFPLGTVINGYILYLVASKKGVDVFSDDYKAVLAATPQIRYKTPILGWIIMGLGVLVVGGAILAVLTSQ